MTKEHPTATADELFSIFLPKYTSKSFVNRVLLNNFYRCVENSLGHLNSNDRVLEVGCGVGESSLRIKNMLSDQLFEISDYDERYIQKFSEINFPIPFRQESVMALDRDDKSFDMVILLEVLEHLDDYNQALSELFRVSNNYVLISTPNEPLWRILNLLRGMYWSDFGNTYGHVNHWSTRGLVNLITQYGEIVKVYRPIPWTIVLAKSNKN
ncbi:MAG: class I SAM-dependent methyltransferase [Bellilinea sp.]